MLVSREVLAPYNILDQYWFLNNGSNNFTGNFIRDQYFINHQSELINGLYCALGDDDSGWQLEIYNGSNWRIMAVTQSRIIITTAGLQAATNNSADVHGFKVSITRIQVVENPIYSTLPLSQFTETDFVKNNIVILDTNDGDYNLHDNLQYKRTIRAGLQYIVSIGSGQLAKTWPNSNTYDKTDYTVGAVGLYITDNNTGNQVLFAIYNSSVKIEKYGNTFDSVGNKIIFNLTLAMNNLGYIADVSMLNQDVSSIPETLYGYTGQSYVDNGVSLPDPETAPYNLYLVDNLGNSGVPALAVRQINSANSSTWQYFEPTTNYIEIDLAKLATNVEIFNLVYFNQTSGMYELAQGDIENNYTTTRNLKGAFGVVTSIKPDSQFGPGKAIIVFSGNVINNNAQYNYCANSIPLYEAQLTFPNSINYKEGERIYYISPEGIKFTIFISQVDLIGQITKCSISPIEGNINMAVVAPAAFYYENPTQDNIGTGAEINILSTQIKNPPLYAWNSSTIPGLQQGIPIYCSQNNPGCLTTNTTDSFVGWVIDLTNGRCNLRLGFDIRNEATTTSYGTVRYATQSEVKNKVPLVAVSADLLGNNYIPIAPPNQNTPVINSSNDGRAWNNKLPITTYTNWQVPIVSTYGGFNPSGNLNDYNLNPTPGFIGISYRALYADLAEYYEADAKYDKGTLIKFGGAYEITLATDEADGIISTAPGLELGEPRTPRDHPVALVGKVPVLFDGYDHPTHGGRFYLSSKIPGRASPIPNGKCLGKVLSDKIDGIKLMCVIRIDFTPTIY